MLGDMLSDTWRLTPPPPIPGEVSYTPGSLALSAVESALIYLPLREPPKIPPVMAGEDPEVVMVHPWQNWYTDVKSGKRTFSFKGQSVEYRFNPSFFRFSNFWGFSPENSLFSANSNDFEIITH